MPKLYHAPLDPHSRFVRLALAEHAMGFDLVEENVACRRREFLILNPAGTLPVLVEEAGQIVPGAGVIAEYLDDTRGLALGERRLLPPAPVQRVEVRRLVNWFNQKFWNEVAEPLIHEKLHKLSLRPGEGGRAPNTAVLKAARANLRYHLAYVAHLVARRNWLAGDQLSYADLAAAAHLSTVDYLGDVPWSEENAAKEWYARIKSRPGFRALLADRIRGLPPAAHYTDLDF